MIKIDVIIKDDRGSHNVKEDCWTNLTPQQAIDNLRMKYGVTRGFGAWLEKMDSFIWKLDEKLADEVKGLRKELMEEELYEHRRAERLREQGLSEQRNME